MLPSPYSARPMCFGPRQLSSEFVSLFVSENVTEMHRPGRSVKTPFQGLDKIIPVANNSKKYKLVQRIIRSTSLCYYQDSHDISKNKIQSIR